MPEGVHALPAAVAAMCQAPAVRTITERFASAGRTLYAVGGCVRDALNGDVAVSPDIDFTTDAPPDIITQILEPLGSIWDAGARFGTIGVAISDGRGGFEKIEVTTHRAETYDVSSRKPDVVLVTDINEDLGRRDLTINAIALRLAPGPPAIFDPFGGADDLVAQVLRTPSDPRRTLDDDPLRILRVIRFAARFGFAVDADLVAACIEFAGRLDIVAAERRTDELRKILGLGGQRCVTAFELATHVGVTAHLLGGVAMTDELRSALRHLGDSRLVLAAIATDSLLAGADATARLRACRLSNIEITPAVEVARLVAGVALDTTNPASVRALLRRHGVSTNADAVVVSASFGMTRALFQAVVRDVLAQHPGLDTSPLPIDGNDALAVGLRGPAVAAALRRVEAAFCADPDLDRQAALALLH